MKTPNLIDILSEPTEPKPDILHANTPEETVQTVLEEKPKPNPDDFIEPEPVEEPPTPQTETIKKPLTLEEQEQTAEMVVATYDAIQTLTFPFLYQRALFSKEERALLKDIKVKMRQSGIASLEEHEQILFDKYTTYSDLKDNVSFTPDEADLIIKPLAQVFKKYNVSLGPEMLLIGALATVSLPRFLPFFTPLEKL